MSGINIVGENGMYQIEDGYMNYLAYQQGVVPSDTPKEDLTQIGDMLFVRPQSGVGTLSAYWTIADNICVLTCTTGNIEYVSVRLGNTMSGSSNPYGFRVFGQDGSLVFDSGTKYLIPIASSAIPATPISASPTVTLTLAAPPAHRKRYVDASILTEVGVEEGETSDWGYFLMPKIQFISPTSIGAWIERIEGGPPASLYGSSSHPFFIGDF